MTDAAEQGIMPCICYRQKTCLEDRRTFRTLANIYDGTFCESNQLFIFSKSSIIDLRQWMPEMPE